MKYNYLEMSFQIQLHRNFLSQIRYRYRYQRDSRSWTVRSDRLHHVCAWREGKKKRTILQYLK